MENREAIEVLRFNADFCDAELEDAINLAISALKSRKLISVARHASINILMWMQVLAVIASEQKTITYHTRGKKYEIYR